MEPVLDVPGPSVESLGFCQFQSGLSGQRSYEVNIEVDTVSVSTPLRVLFRKNIDCFTDGAKRRDAVTGLA